MRFLQHDANGEIILTEPFLPGRAPPYAILSHTWGSPGDEVTLQDLRNGTGRDKEGYTKIRFCVERREQRDGIIRGVELQTAITSMFAWYRESQRCLVYLSDVSTVDDDAAFRNSRWYTRGWTLQELIAPRSVEFFTSRGARIGSKRDLEEVIQSVTNIPLTALRGESLSNFGIRERLDWMHGRETTLAEDYAYCLFGILDVSLPIIYGESRRAAMDRLLERAGILLSQHMRDKSLVWDIGAQRLLPESGFSEAAPALVECRGSLVAVWRGRTEAFWVTPFVNINSLYWTTLRKSNDGIHLIAEPPKPIQGNVESPERPGLATLANKLVAVWKGVNHDTLYFSTLNHGSRRWENPGAVHPQAVSSAGPALACWEWNGSARVCAVWKGAGSDLNIYLSWYDGKRWSWPKPLQFAQTDATPEITYRNGELFLAWKASGTDKLFWMRLDSDGNALLVEPMRARRHHLRRMEGSGKSRRLTAGSLVGRRREIRARTACPQQHHD
ncbi:hypothetical protein B0T18DRAFT_389484 [Schizothecium vesticola]|uniref:HET-domain-containing protein n=1 Tax=Schizothecium vesticola TaxID=314040 RepID=A0AA40F2P9_9PEZI|nr:hypothetical protein B0T18DRAFT_389484 [Schizothecium vesticola]